MTDFPFSWDEFKNMPEDPPQDYELISFEEDGDWLFAFAVAHMGEKLVVDLPDYLAQILARALVEHHEIVREMTFQEGQISTYYLREEKHLLSVVGKVLHTLRGRGLSFYLNKDGVQDSLFRLVPVGAATYLTE